MYGYTQEKELQIGQMITMDVSRHLQTGEIAFQPDFVDHDETAGRSSVRFYFPTNNGFSLRLGERWTGKVKNFRVGNKITRDHRIPIYVQVEVIARSEESAQKFNYETCEWVTKVYSGNVLIDEIRKPATKAEVAYRDGNDIVIVEEIRVGGEVVHFHFNHWNRLSSAEYVELTKKRLGSLLPKNFNPRQMLKEIKPLPAEYRKEY
jgi:hypothetical protein